MRGLTIQWKILPQRFRRILTIILRVCCRQLIVSNSVTDIKVQFVSICQRDAIFARKHLCWSLQHKERSQERSFPVNTVKFLRIPFFTEHLRWLLLNRCDKSNRIYITLSKIAVGFMNCFRSSRPELFCKKGVLKNFTKLTGKHLC